MNASLLTFGLIAEVALVAGQLFLKISMRPATPAHAPSKPFRAALFTLSIAAQSIYFFLWLGLLEKFPLSSVYPFDAVAPVLLVILGIVILREKLKLRALAAISCILVGLILISLS